MISMQDSINFIIGLIFNQSYDSSKAWDAPHAIKERLNVSALDLQELQNIGEDGLRNVIEKQPCLHRFPQKIANYTYVSIAIINQKFGGDPRNIWAEKKCNSILENMNKLHGIGNHKSIQGLILLSYLDDSIKVPKKYYNYIERNCPGVLKNIEYNISQITSK